MTGRESTEPLDPAQIMAKHPAHQAEMDQWSPNGRVCWGHNHVIPWPCETYRLAEALAAERARVQRVEALRAKSWRALSPVQIYTDVVSDWELGIALAGDTEGNG